jgi:hypothetical protein
MKIQFEAVVEAPDGTPLGDAEAWVKSSPQPETPPCYGMRADGTLVVLQSTVEAAIGAQTAPVHGTPWRVDVDLNNTTEGWSDSVASRKHSHRVTPLTFSAVR